MINTRKIYTIAFTILFIAGFSISVANIHHANSFFIPKEAKGKNLASTNPESAITFDPSITLQGVLYSLNEHYVDKIDSELMTKMSVNLTKGMLRELGDSNTRYLDKEEMSILKDAQNGTFHGIGVRPVIKTQKYDNTIEEETLVVGSVIPESPGAKAGLKAGDVIISLNGKNILPYNPYGRLEKKVDEYRRHPDDKREKELKLFVDAENKRLENGMGILAAEREVSKDSEGKIKLEINRNGTKKEINLNAEEISLEPIKEKVIYDKYMYIGVNALMDNLPNAMEKSVERVNKDPKIKAIVLDLRNVFGGTYKIATETMKYLTPNSSLGEIKTKNNKPFDLTIPDYKTPLKGKKILVLVDKGTAKYGELMANTLKNAGNVLIGEETAGDMMDISVFGLDNGGGYTMTSGEFSFSSKDENKSVKPDVKTSLPANYLDISKTTIEKYLK